MKLRTLLDHANDETWIKVKDGEDEHIVWAADYIGGHPDVMPDLEPLLGRTFDEFWLEYHRDPERPRERTPMICVELNARRGGRRNGKTEQPCTVDDLTAVVSVEGDNCHLMFSFNSSASCCQENENVIQLETYPNYGWNVDKRDPRLAKRFWEVWNEENGKQVGGIELDDEFSYAAARRLVRGFPKLDPEDLATAKDGTYVVKTDLGTKD